MLTQVGKIFWGFIIFIFDFILSFLPYIKKKFWKRWYSWLSKDKDKESHFIFMNYGHHELNSREEWKERAPFKKENGFFFRK